MQTPIIFVYHQITELDAQRDPYRISVTPQAFAMQMEYLATEGYTAVTLAEAVDAMRAGKALAPKTVVITFDDGYKDNYDEAFPILKRYHFPATIFLVADRIGDNAVWDAQYGTPLPLMTWDNAREMHAAGIEFGSHTATHQRLEDLAPQDAEKEICDSKMTIEMQLGQPIHTFAYPYESFNQQIQDITAQCGYRAACGTPRMAETFYNLWRVEIGRVDADLEIFKRKLSRMWKPMNEAKRRLRPLKRLIKR